MHLLSLGTGLMGDQLHSQDLSGKFPCFFCTLGDLYAAALATTAGVNLSFYHDAFSAI